MGHREGGVCGHVHQAGGAQAAGQRAPVTQVDPPLGQQGPKAAADAVGQDLGRADLLQAAQRLEGGVGVLDEQDAAGAQGIDHV